MQPLRLRRFDGVYDFALAWYLDPETVAEAEEVELGFKRALFRHTAGKFLVILVYNCKIFLCLTKNGFS